MKKVRRVRSPTQEPVSEEDKLYVTSLCGALILTAVVYLTVCVPLCFRFADFAGKNGWAVLFFSEVPQPSKQLFGIALLRYVGFETYFERSFWMAMGTAYGLIGIIAPLI